MTELYPEEPEFSVLPQEIVSSSAYANAPKPHVTMLTYESKDLAKDEKFSRYQIHLLASDKTLTRYRTREVDYRDPGFFLKEGTPIIRGEGVGYGGMFMLAYMKWHSIIGKKLTDKNYYKKYRMTDMKNIQGHLFPLAVGNQLTFNYRDISQNKRSQSNQADAQENGKMIYQVIDHQVGFQGVEKKVPGDIYLVKVSKMTDRNPQQTTLYEYYFSTSLGWYVGARYYKNNQPVAFYQLVTWE
jgi:hypothetical protein